MDYMAYREIGTSLYASDKNALLGFEGYEARPVYSPSPWTGADRDQKLGELLGWAVRTEPQRYGRAIDLLRDDPQFRPIIGAAGLAEC